ncbi:unnamed protein product, partial [Ectocarpus sp. 12 AP-2014]
LLPPPSAPAPPAPAPHLQQSHVRRRRHLAAELLSHRDPVGEQRHPLLPLLDSRPIRSARLAVGLSLPHLSHPPHLHLQTLQSLRRVLLCSPQHWRPPPLRHRRRLALVLRSPLGQQKE